MMPGPRRIPEALLERYLADALAPEVRARLEARLADSPEDRARLAELRADSAAFLLQHPPGVLVSRFQEQPRRAGWWRWPALLVPALAAGLAALWLLQPPVDPPDVNPPDGDPPYTIKGSDVVLVLHRRAGEGSAPVTPAQLLAPGDAIRFELKAPAPGFVAVLGKDARGTISVYYPFGGTTAEAYDTGQPLLSGAIALDDTLGREDLYALYAKSPFELAWAVQALKEGRALEKAAPRGVSVGHTFFLKQK